jgi:hypothetical protein
MIFLLKTRAKVHIISRTRTYLCEKKPKIEKKELFIDLEQKDGFPDRRTEGQKNIWIYLGNSKE